MTSQEKRVEVLEQAVAVDQGVDVVCLFWSEETPEERARVKAEAKARVASGQQKPGRLYWRDGSEASLP